MIVSCVDCGRLTAEAEGSCSHCQQRKQAKDIQQSKLDYWKDRANTLALKSGKVAVVVDCGNDSFQVWLKAVADEWKHKYVWATGDSPCA